MARKTGQILAALVLAASGFTLAVLALALSSCDSPAAKPAVNEQADLSNIFSNGPFYYDVSPINATTSIVSLQSNGVILNAPGPSEHPAFDGCLLSKLVETGKVQIVPYNTPEGFWFSTSVLKNDPYGRLKIDLGSASVTSTSSVRRYKVEDQNFFSEIVNYDLVHSTAIENLPKLGPFTLRFIYREDPATGSWALDSWNYVAPEGPAGATPSLEGIEQADLPAIQAQSGLSTCDTSPVKNAVAAVVRQNQKREEAEVASLGLTPTSNVYIVAASAGGIEYFDNNAIVTNAIPAQAISIATANCRSLDIEGHRDWQLISDQDVLKIKRYHGGGANEALIDTDDHTLWYGLIRQLGSLQSASLATLGASTPGNTGWEVWNTGQVSSGRPFGAVPQNWVAICKRGGNPPAMNIPPPPKFAVSPLKQ